VWPEKVRRIAPVDVSNRVAIWSYPPAIAFAPSEEKATLKTQASYLSKVSVFTPVSIFHNFAELLFTELKLPVSKRVPSGEYATLETLCCVKLVLSSAPVSVLHSVTAS